MSGEVIAPNCSQGGPRHGTRHLPQRQSGTVQRHLWRSDLQPRVGLAWTPASWREVCSPVLRSVCLSYLEGTGTNLRLPVNNPPSHGRRLASLTAGCQCRPRKLETASDLGFPQLTPSAQLLVRVWDPHMQPAITYQWNFTWQQLLSSSLTLQAGYVGQHGIHEMVPTPYLQRRLLVRLVAFR